MIILTESKMQNPELAIDVNTDENSQIVQQKLLGFQIQISMKKNVKIKIALS